MVRYARHCVCYVESFKMSSNIMGLASLVNQHPLVLTRGCWLIKLGVSMCEDDK